MCDYQLKPNSSVELGAVKKNSVSGIFCASCVVRRASKHVAQSTKKTQKVVIKNVVSLKSDPETSSG